MKRPGVIIRLSDGRKAIVYDNQALLKEKKKIIINLVDDSYNLLKNESGKPKIIIKDLDVYNSENKEGINKLIGYVD